MSNSTIADTPINNLSLREQVDQKSLNLLRLQGRNETMKLIFGLIGTTTNLLLFLTITRTARLAKVKSQLVIASLAFAETINQITFIYQGGRRTFFYLTEWPETNYQLPCALLAFPPTFTGNPLFMMMFLLSLDRLLAIGAPTAYSTRPARPYIIGVNAIAWSFALVHVPFAFINVDYNALLPACTAATTLSPGYLRGLYYEANVFNAVMFAFYTATLTILVRRLISTSRLAETQRRDARRQLELGTVKTVAVIVAMYFLCYGTTTILNAILASDAVSPETRAKYSIVPGILLYLNSISHLPIYLIMSKGFRKAFAETICRRAENVVKPIQSK